MITDPIRPQKAMPLSHPWQVCKCFQVADVTTKCAKVAGAALGTPVDFSTKAAWVTKPSGQREKGALLGQSSQNIRTQHGGTESCGALPKINCRALLLEGITASFSCLVQWLAFCEWQELVAGGREKEPWQETEESEQQSARRDSASIAQLFGTMSHGRTVQSPACLAALQMRSSCKWPLVATCRPEQAIACQHAIECSKMSTRSGCVPLFPPSSGKKTTHNLPKPRTSVAGCLCNCRRLTLSLPLSCLGEP